MKKQLLLLFCLLMICFSNMALGEKIDGINYDLDSETKTASVTSKSSGEYSGSIIIPSSVYYNGVHYRVTSIGYRAFYNCTGLTSIYIPNGVTSIGSYAFCGCTGLSSIDIPNGVTSIGEGAFYNLHLKSVTIGSGVVSIGEYAFTNPVKVIWLTNTPPSGYKNVNGTVNYVANNLYTSLYNYIVYPSLSSIFEVGGIKYVPVSPSERTCDAIDCNYDETVTDVFIGNLVSFKGIDMAVKQIRQYTCYENISLNNIYLANEENVGECAFANCSNLKTVKISNDVQKIGKYAFEGCSKLETVTIGNGVKNIGSYLFEGCTSLKYVFMDDYTGTGADELYLGSNGKNPLFSDCPLDSVYIGRNISYPTESCGYSPFNNNKNLRSVVFSNQETEITEYEFFGCSNLQYAQIGNGVQNIGEYAFSDCSSLPSINIPDNVIDLGESAFSGCSKLETVTIGNGIKTIGLSAFAGCTSLPSINISDNVIDLGESAFSGCSKLETVTIGNGIGAIKDQTFYYCSALKNVKIGSAVKTIGLSAFAGCSSLPSIKIPYNVSKISNSTFSKCTSLKYVFMDDYIGTEEDGGLALESNGNNPLFSDCPLDSVYIGRNISYSTESSQGYSPFYKNKYLRSVVFSNNVTEITKYGFSGCTYLKNVHIGDGVKTIGSSAFAGCSSLPSINIPDNVIDLGESAFSGCSKLETVTIGNGIKTIGLSAFAGCSSLPSINIPDNVIDLGESAFSGCSKLETVTIGNGIKTIGLSAFAGCSSLPSIRIPYNVSKISNSTFSKCTSLKYVFMDDYTGTGTDELYLGSNGNNPLFSDCPLDSVYVGRNISYSTESYQGYSPFYRNTFLRSVHITDRETEISPNEFYGCTNLKNVRIGDGVTTIGDWAFSGCANLDYFAFGAKVQSIGKEAFSDCVLVTNIISRATTPPTCGSQALDDINKWECTLTVPPGMLAAYQAAAQWKEFFFIEEKDVEELEEPEELASYEYSATCEINQDYVPGKNHNITIDWDAIAEALGVENTTLKIYAVMPDGTLDENYGRGNTDGWRDANGNWASWNSADNLFYVQFSGLTLDGVGCMRTAEPTTYTAVFKVVDANNTDGNWVTLKISLEVKDPNALPITALDVTGATPQYFYNVKAQGFLVGGNDYNTRASVGSQGYLMHFEANGDTYKLCASNQTGSDYPANELDYDGNGDIWVDGADRAGAGKWKFNVNADGTFTISNTTANGLLSIVPSKNDTRLYMSEDADAQCTWIAVSEEQFATYSKIAMVKEESIILAEIKEFIESTNIYTPDAYETYYALYADAIEKNQAGEVVGNLDNPNKVHGWHASNAYDDYLLSAWSINGEQCSDFNKPLYINTWSSEADNKANSSSMHVPFYEYWTGDDNSLGANTLEATVTGIKNGSYTVEALVRVRIKDGAVAPAYGITLSANGGAEVDVCTGNGCDDGAQFRYGIFKADAVVTDGKLVIDFNIAADNNISWLTFKKVKYSKKAGITLGDVNNDGVVDISDYIGVANHILGNTPEGFNEVAADVNNDGAIDISDYIGVANIDPDGETVIPEGK